MREFRFKTLRFREKGDQLIGNFFRVFYFTIPLADIKKLGEYRIEEGAIIFEDDSPRVERRFLQHIDTGLQHLTNRITGKKTVYVHKDSGIPLIGSVELGLVDRDTNCIEVKPMTSCNIECVYCSVDEDRRPIDFVIDPDYILEEFAKLAKLKGDEPLEAHIQTQGEPTLYSEMAYLIRGLRAIPGVVSVSIDTNGTLLTKKYVDEMREAGLTRFNISLDAMDPKRAQEIAGTKGYSLEKVLESIKYVCSVMNCIIAPVWVPGWNDDQMDAICEFVKSLQDLPHPPILLIQNFLFYRNGRNPSKSQSMDTFYSKLKALEKKHGLKLIGGEYDFTIKPTKPTPTSFKKGEVVQAEIIGPGRLKDQKYAVARDRLISVFNTKKSGAVELKITQTKHNIYMADVL